VWADWVRDPGGPGVSGDQRQAIKTQFNKPVWHYVDLPFVHPDDAEKLDAIKIRKQILEPAFDEKGEPRHALAALEKATKQLRSADTSASDRAVALTWLCHLVGDLHQPLHGTALYSTKPALDPPNGDEGGNRLAFKINAEDARAVNLHFYWDSLLFRHEPSFAVMDGVVAHWLSEKAMQRDQFPEFKNTDFLAWAEESLELAKAVVYRHQGRLLPLRVIPRKAKLTGLDAPVLPEGYAQIAEKTAARRMILAGYRLADELAPITKVGK
jgi:hypothetical protein